jgi:hypothetical protein
MFQRENYFINKRLQKPRRLHLKCMPAVNNVNKTNRNTIHSLANFMKFFLLPTETVIVARPVLIIIRFNS